MPNDIADGAGWEDGGIVEFEVKCGLCGRDLPAFSAYVSLHGEGYAWEIELGRDYDISEIRTAKSFPSAPDQKVRDSAPASRNNRWTLVCARKRCHFRRILTRDKVEKAMLSAWRVRRHVLVAGDDL